MAALDRDAVEWCLRHRLFEPDDVSARMGCGYGIAHALPHAPESTIAAATRHFYWGAAFDDYCDTHPDPMVLAAEVGELHRVMDTAPAAAVPSGNRWVASLRALRNELEAVLTEDEFAVFTHAHAVWLTGQLWFTALQDRPTAPRVEEWLRMRWAKSGVATLVPFTGSSCGIDALAARHRGEPAVRAFTESVMMSCALLNDLASAAKEIATGTAVTNLVTVLAGPVHTTVNPVAAVELYERIVGLAYRLQQRLRIDPRPDVARYAVELPRWVPAGIAWASSTARYHDLTATDTVKSVAPHVTVTTVPTVWDPDDRTPPPYPEISWWWEQLR
ncbi:hypothetical protein ACFWPH_28055 [Nocardia sp. NPDC058499]|uniref:terpene synthase family protein n=1 Tax=Nocardia sp. NPDC058499 TaxID=3346530 RepID=UPI00365B720F